jgi:DNA mismatch repair protein MutH
MKKTSYFVALALIGLGQMAIAGTQDFKATACQVKKVTAHSKASAMDTTFVTAAVSCHSGVQLEVYTVTAIAGQILVAARNSGNLVDLVYRNFGSSFDGTSGQILSITE